MAKAKLNPATDTPKNLIDITMDFMAEYIELKSDEDKKWFGDLVFKNLIEKKNSKGGITRTYNAKEVRKEFVRRFFPNLIKSSKSSSKLDVILSWRNL